MDDSSSLSSSSSAEAGEHHDDYERKRVTHSSNPVQDIAKKSSSSKANRAAMTEVGEQIQQQEAGTYLRKDQSHDGNPNRSSHNNDGVASFSGSPSIVLHDIMKQSHHLPRLLPFPYRLHHMLNDVERTENSNIVSWMPNGRSFKVHKPIEFVRTTKYGMRVYRVDVRYCFHSLRLESYIFVLRLRLFPNLSDKFRCTGLLQHDPIQELQETIAQLRV